MDTGIYFFITGMFLISTLMICIIHIKRNINNSNVNYNYNFTEPIIVESLPMYTPRYELEYIE